MVLNNKPSMFTVYFPSNFFYPEVKDKWEPLIHRMKLPYETIDDFMNQQIQSVTFPGASLDTVEQQHQQYSFTYQGGKEMEPLINRELKLTFKLTESYLSYWIIWDQVDRFLHYASNVRDKKDLWMEPIKLGFINDAGFTLVEFTFWEITPSSLTELNLSYAATVASYNTFSWNLKFNRFDTH